MTFPIDFVLMQYLIVSKQNYYRILKTETSNENLELNQQLAKKLHINISNGIDFIGNNT